MGIYFEQALQTMTQQKKKKKSDIDIQGEKGTFFTSSSREQLNLVLTSLADLEAAKK